MSGEAPKRRLRMTLSLGADDVDSLAAALRSISHDIEYESGETRNVTSGGWSDGYHYEVELTDPDMTGDRYRDLLEVWRQERVAAASPVTAEANNERKAEK